MGMVLEEFINAYARSGDFIHVYHDGIADHFRMEDMLKLRYDPNILPLLNREVKNFSSRYNVVDNLKMIAIEL